MNKKKTINKLNFCDSCIHVFGEQDINLKQNIIKNKNELSKYCGICGQLIDNTQEDKNEQVSLVKSALKNPNLTVVCFTAPSIRVSVSNELLDGDFKDCQGKINTALRLLGFDVVFDMNIGADFTIVEEAHEFVERLKTNTNLPLMTSCCPGWVNFIRKAYPEFVKNLSTCKSPQQMFGALISKYYAQSIGKKSTDLFVVSLVPCVIKKLEAREEDINASVGYDVDAVITTKDFIDLIRENNIDFKNLESSLFDDFFGTASGAGSIFGTTGGVMESALRTIGDSIDHEDLDEAMYKLVRGHDAIRRAEIPFKNKLIKVAVVSGLKNVKKLLESINYITLLCRTFLLHKSHSLSACRRSDRELRR